MRNLGALRRIWSPFLVLAGLASVLWLLAASNGYG